jgi:hypothetical protein
MRVPANGFVKIDVAGSWVNAAGADSATCGTRAAGPEPRV